MDLVEITEKHSLSREQAAKLLHRIADSMERHNKLEFMRNGKKLRIDVADQVALELEVEVETEESSLEIEISW